VLVAVEGVAGGVLVFSLSVVSKGCSTVLDADSRWVLSAIGDKVVAIGSLGDVLIGSSVVEEGST
jgi:hypothetical protein